MNIKLFLIFFMSVLHYAFSSNLNSCQDVKEIFRVKNVSHYEQVPVRRISGDQLSICISRSTCCTSDIEKGFLTPVNEGLKDMIKSSISYLRTHLINDAYKFRDQVLELIIKSSNSTEEVLSQVHRAKSGSKTLVGDLFNDLSRYMYGEEIELDELILEFFKKLFPHVYERDISRGQSLTVKERACVINSYSEVRPFSEMPQSIAKSTKIAFETARAMVVGLATALDVVNETENAEFTSGCTQAMVRLTHCSTCMGLIQAKPCPDLCKNVFRGCLAGLAEFDAPWNKLIKALQRVSAAMVGQNNVQMLMNGMSAKISGAVLYAIENGSKIHAKISEQCGIRERSKRSLTISHTSSLLNRGSPLMEDANSLYSNLQNIVQQLAESLDYFGNLPDTMCREHSLAESSHSGCWNGQDMAEYHVPVVGTGIEAQQNNSETGSVNFQYSIKLLVAKMHTSEFKLMQCIHYKPQSDSKIIEGSGKGSGDLPGNFEDDEDYEDEMENGSGSGLIPGSDEKHSPIDLDDDQEIHVPEKGGSSTIASSAILLALTATLVACWWK